MDRNGMSWKVTTWGARKDTIPAIVRLSDPSIWSAYQSTDVQTFTSNTHSISVLSLAVDSGFAP